MGRMSEQRKEHRTERIRRAAFELFEEQGYVATTMEQIAERADFSVRTLYNYYESKADILVDTLNTAKEEFLHEAARYLETTQDTPARQYAALFRLFHERIPHNRELMREILSAILSPHTRIKEKLAPGFELLKEATGRLLARYAAEDLLPPGMDRAELADLMVCFGAGADLLYRLGDIPDLAALEAKAEMFMEYLLRGLKRAE